MIVTETLLLLLAVLLGALINLVGVTLGAHYVFKTKREPHESLLNFKQPEARVFQYDPASENMSEVGEYDFETAEGFKAEGVPFDGPADWHNQRLQAQMEKDIAEQEILQSDQGDLPGV